MHHSDNHWHDRRLIDLIAMIALIAVIAAGVALWSTSRMPPEAHTSFIVPSQTTRW
jgi:hypothetical protein